MAGEPKEPVAALETGTVARGHSVMAGGRMVPPGEEVSLSVAEIVHLRKRGFLVDPDAEIVKEANGPTFTRR